MFNFMFPTLFFLLIPTLVQGQLDPFTVPIHRVERPQVNLASPYNRHVLGSQISVINSRQFIYEVYITIGGQTFPVLLDTGSSDLWILSGPCTNDDCKTISTYRPSSTVILSDTSFKIDYLLGSVTGSVACDTIILGSYELPCQVFGMTNQTTGLNLATNGNAGILGMAFPSVATIQSSNGATILANMFNYLDDASRFFAIKLGRQSGSDSTSSFSVGKLDSNFAPDFSDFFFTPVLQAGADAYDYWKLPIQYITINSTILRISPSLVRDSPNAIAVMDTGTTLILGPSADVTAFWKTINSGTSEVARKNFATDMWEIKCEKAVSVAFALGEGVNMKEFPIHPEDVNWAAGGNGTGWCLGGVQENDKVNSGDWLLGDVFLRNVYASHHGDNSTHPPTIGLRSMTDTSRALDEFRKNRGLDLSPASTIETEGRSAASMHSTLIYSASSGCGFVVGMISTLVFRAIHEKP